MQFICWKRINNMARYRIVIEVNVDDKVRRSTVNEMANWCMRECVNVWSNPVFLSTEIVEDGKEVQVLRK
jgi:hypothetical protein